MFLTTKIFFYSVDGEGAFPLLFENNFTFCVLEKELGANHLCDVLCLVWQYLPPYDIFSEILSISEAAFLWVLKAIRSLSPCLKDIWSWEW